MDFVEKNAGSGVRLTAHVTFSIATALILLVVAARGVRAQQSDGQPYEVGSADEYVRDDNPGPAPELSPRTVHEVPELGIEVSDGMGKLETGAALHGLIVTRVQPDGPAARAGLKNQRDVAKAVLMGTLVAGSLFFPPAFFGAIAVSQSDIGESHDTIVAVDSERTRDFKDLDHVIRRSGEGPILYLSVIRGGRRNQVELIVNTLRGQTE